MGITAYQLLNPSIAGAITAVVTEVQTLQSVNPELLPHKLRNAHKQYLLRIAGEPIDRHLAPFSLFAGFSKFAPGLQSSWNGHENFNY